MGGVGWLWTTVQLLWTTVTLWAAVTLRTVIRTERRREGSAIIWGWNKSFIRYLDVHWGQGAWSGLFLKLMSIPRCSFDILKDDLGAPRSTFPHTVYMVAGTQAESAKQNYVAFLRLEKLGQVGEGTVGVREEGGTEEGGQSGQMGGTWGMGGSH